MKLKCQRNERVKKSQINRLWRDFEVLEMKNLENISDYFTRVMGVANNLRNLREDMTDAKVVERILRTLMEKYDYIVCAIEESKDIDALSIKELQRCLLKWSTNFGICYWNI